jgi:clan AA aspartic protease (TIGR02281 family)
VNAKEYETAYNAYDELKKLNYSGKGTNFYAVNKINAEEQIFSTAKERDQMVKLGTHEKPRNEELPSKRGEIYKNMALILVQNGKVAEAKKAIAEARVANPEDKTLILTEANLYLDTKDFDTYKKLITEVLAQSPNDADLVFNLGVISYNAKNLADAEAYYSRALEIKPDYVNAILNLAILKLDADKKLFEEIQKLGNSEKDNKRYEVLKKQREVVFKSALPFLEKAAELDGSNKEVISTLLSVYRALEMTDKVKALKNGEKVVASSPLPISKVKSLPDTNSITISMKKQDGGTFEIPCVVNGVPMNFIFDTGASDVTISLTEANFLLKQNKLSSDDVIGKEKYQIANGDIEEGYVIIIRSLEFSGVKLKDVRASVVKNLNAPLLLGQSALSKLGKITIDYNNNKLLIIK